MLLLLGLKVRQFKVLVINKVFLLPESKHVYTFVTISSYLYNEERLQDEVATKDYAVGLLNSQHSLGSNSENLKQKVTPKNDGLSRN